MYDVTPTEYVCINTVHVSTIEFLSQMKKDRNK